MEYALLAYGGMDATGPLR